MRDAKLERRLKAIAAHFPEVLDMHDIQVKRVRDRLYVSCHCTMKSELPITQVHDVTAALEDRVKENFQQIYRVTIHPEPSDEK